MSNPVDLQKEEERLYAAIAKKSQPQSLTDIKRNKEIQAKREQERKRKAEEEAARNQQNKEAHNQKKAELAKNKVAEERERGRERELQEQAEVDKKLSGGANDDDDVAATKEAARFAKMMGITSQKLMSDSPKSQPKSATSTEEKVQSAGLKDANAQSEEEAARLAHSFGISSRKLDPKQVAEDEAKEAHRKDFEKKIEEMDTSDPKAFSRAFLNDPEVLNHLKEVKGIVAVNQLKGCDIPGGHKF